MARRNGVGWTGALLASAFVLAACGASTGGGAGAQATSTANPAAKPGAGTGGSGGRIACEAFSKADAQAALGKPVGPPSTTGNPHSCSYMGTDGYGGLTVNTISSRRVAEVVARSISGAPVSGLGDEAFYGGSELVVVKGDAGFSIDLALPNANQSLTNAKELAQKILAKF